jgi:outer membrane lipase/esterase
MMLWADGLRAAMRATGLALGAALLASCGGGEQVEKFQPTRIVAFGDENSVIEDVPGEAVDATKRNGRKYAVNYKADASAARDCRLLPIWNQSLATSYGLTFRECNPSGGPATGRIYAQPNTTAAAVQTQVDSFLADNPGNGFSNKVLVTVMAGTNDVRAQYMNVKGGTPEADAIAAVEAAGTALAAQVNRIGQAGGRVIVSTIYDLGISPYGVAQVTADKALLTQLTTRFNAKLRGGLLNDGHLIGLVLFDESLRSIVVNGVGVNVSDQACAGMVPDCDTTTLATAVTPTMVTPPTRDTVTSWLWADDRHLGPYAQTTLGSLAETRATGNPF